MSDPSVVESAYLSADNADIDNVLWEIAPVLFDWGRRTGSASLLSLGDRMMTALESSVTADSVEAFRARNRVLRPLVGDAQDALASPSRISVGDLEEVRDALRALSRRMSARDAVRPGS